MEDLLKCRGPDECHSLLAKISTEQLMFSMQMIGNTLWMQGEKAGVQPMESELGALMFNGDIFEKNWNPNICDTEEIFKKLNPEIIVGKSKIIYESYILYAY